MVIKKDGYKKLDLWVAAVVRGSVPEKRETEILTKQQWQIFYFESEART